MEKNLFSSLHFKNGKKEYVLHHSLSFGIYFIAGKKYFGHLANRRPGLKTGLCRRAKTYLTYPRGHQAYRYYHNIDLLYFKYILLLN